MIASTGDVYGAAEWLRFIGRLHPIAVHLPIGLLAGVAIAEFVTFFRKPEKVSATRRLLVWVTAIGAAAAAFAGWQLAEEGGYPDDLLFWHRALGITFAAVLLFGAVLSLTRAWHSVILRLLFLGFAGVLVTVGGHLGGSMTHGSSFISVYAPPALAKLLNPEREPAVPSPLTDEFAPDQSASIRSDAQLVMEILESRCVECHGSTRQKGRLRLDSPEEVARVIVAGNPSRSELFQRIALPHSDAEIMPPTGEPLTDDEVLSVLRWIRDGAVFDNPATDDPEKLQETPTPNEVGPPIPASPAMITPVPMSDGGALAVDFSLSTDELDPGALDTLPPIAARIAELSFAGRDVRGLELHTQLPELKRLRLERSTATDDLVRSFLSRAPHLEHLNLHSTPITSAIIPAITEAQSLKRVVLYETAISAADLRQLTKARPDLTLISEEELEPPFAGGGPRLILIADETEGRIALLREIALGEPKTLWEDEASTIRDLQLLPSGSVFFQASRTALLEVDPGTNETLWMYDIEKHGEKLVSESPEIYSFERLETGETVIALSAPARIIKVDAEGNFLSETPLTVGQPDREPHTRRVTMTPRGTYLVAHPGDGAVREYTPSGEIVWACDVPSSWHDPMTGETHTGEGDAVYEAHRLVSGNTLIATGDGQGVLEVSPAGDIVWSLARHDLEGITLNRITSVDRLANGNTLVVNSQADDGQPQIIVVTPDKKVAWTFRDDGRFGSGVISCVVTEDTTGYP